MIQLFNHNVQEQLYNKDGKIYINTQETLTQHNYLCVNLRDKLG